MESLLSSIFEEFQAHGQGTGLFFTGCDTYFRFIWERGKVGLGNLWKGYTDVTEAFTHMTLNSYIQLDNSSWYFQMLKNFVVVLCNKISELENVDEAGVDLFCHVNRTMEKISITKAGLLQHSKRAQYQTDLWTTSQLTKQDRPSPEGWGWSWDGEILSWNPVWTTLPIASKACAELIKCGCKSKSGGGARYSCKKSNWTCTELCSSNCTK